MTYNFDEIIDRQHTSSVKWDMHRTPEILPLWVADMDFRSPKPVIEALKKAVDFGVFGYTFAPDELCHEVVNMLKNRHNWQVSSNWIIWLPGLVTGINACCRTACPNPTDQVISATPVYHPFLDAPNHSNCALLTVPMQETDGIWQLDFEAIEHAITPHTRLFLLCNPHNPVGRVFSKSELEQLAEICETHDILICSDEIHCDLVIDNQHTHTPIASISDKIAARTITLQAPSKTYNVAGLGCSFAIIPNHELRQRFQNIIQDFIPFPNMLGYHAALAAYRDGEQWRQQLLSYLRNNHDYLYEKINALPGLKMTKCQATYLAWIDCRELNIENPFEFFKKGGVELNDGAIFGLPGFLRLNFGCPRATLDDALTRIEAAIRTI